MKFNLKHEEKGFTVCLNGINGGKRLIIRDRELKEPELLHWEDVESEIKKRVVEYFKCGNVDLDFDKDTEQKIFCIIKNNLEEFDSE